MLLLLLLLLVCVLEACRLPSTASCRSSRRATCTSRCVAAAPTQAVCVCCFTCISPFLRCCCSGVRPHGPAHVRVGRHAVQRHRPAQRLPAPVHHAGFEEAVGRTGAVPQPLPDVIVFFLFSIVLFYVAPVSPTLTPRRHPHTHLHSPDPAIQRTGAGARPKFWQHRAREELHKGCLDGELLRTLLYSRSEGTKTSQMVCCSATSYNGDRRKTKTTVIVCRWERVEVCVRFSGPYPPLKARHGFGQTPQ